MFAASIYISKNLRSLPGIDLRFLVFAFMIASPLSILQLFRLPNTPGLFADGLRGLASCGLIEFIYVIKLHA